MIKLSDQICWLSSHRDDFISTPRSWSVLLHIIRWTYCISDQIKKICSTYNTSSSYFQNSPLELFPLLGLLSYRIFPLQKIQYAGAQLFNNVVKFSGVNPPTQVTPLASCWSKNQTQNSCLCIPGIKDFTHRQASSGLQPQGSWHVLL